MDAYPPAPHVSEETFLEVESAIRSMADMLGRMIPKQRRPKPKALAQINSTAKALAGLVRSLRVDGVSPMDEGRGAPAYIEALMAPTRKK